MSKPKHYVMNADPGEFKVTPTDSVGDPIIHRPIPEDHDAYRLIGRVVAEWAKLEHELDQIIAEMLGVDTRRIGCVTAQIMGATYRIQAIIALATEANLSKKLLANLGEFKKRCLNPQEMRNRIIHDPWYIKDGSNAIEQFQKWPRDNLKYGHDSAGDLEKFVGRIRRRITTAQHLREAIHAERAP